MTPSDLAQLRAGDIVQKTATGEQYIVLLGTGADHREDVVAVRTLSIRIPDGWELVSAARAAREAAIQVGSIKIEAHGTVTNPM